MFLIHLLLFMIHLLLVETQQWTNQWVVHIPDGKQFADEIASNKGFVNLGEILHSHFHFKFLCENDTICVPAHKPSDEHSEKLIQPSILSFVQQKRLHRNRRFTVTDPLYSYQWFLLDQPDGNDINVNAAWDEGYSGRGVVVTVVDDGIEHNHPDLINNYDSSASYDMNDEDPDPYPNELDAINSHGTRCCGQIAMARNNGVCGIGIAFNARIGAVRMLDGDVSDAIEGRSLSLNPNHVDIYTNSWGPNDDGATVEAPGPQAMAAFRNGVAKGRLGLGNIFFVCGWEWGILRG